MGLTVGAGKVQRAEEAEENSQNCLVAQLDLCILLALNMYTSSGAILHPFCAECSFNGIIPALADESPRNVLDVYRVVGIFIETQTQLASRSRVTRSALKQTTGSPSNPAPIIFSPTERLILRSRALKASFHHVGQRRCEEADEQSQIRHLPLP